MVVERGYSAPVESLRPSLLWLISQLPYGNYQAETMRRPAVGVAGDDLNDVGTRGGKTIAAGRRTGPPSGASNQAGGGNQQKSCNCELAEPGASPLLFPVREKEDQPEQERRPPGDGRTPDATARWSQRTDYR